MEAAILAMTVVRNSSEAHSLPFPDGENYIQQFPESQSKLVTSAASRDD